MSYLVSGIIIFANSIFVLVKENNRFIKNLLLIFMWILFWGSYQNPDYANYSFLFDTIKLTGNGFETSEIGFCFLMKVVSNFGLEYKHFLMIVTLVGLILIDLFVRKYVKKPQIVFVMYFIYPFLLDVIQVRHFFCMSIIIYCIRFIEEDTRNGDIKYIIGILIAFSIHKIAIVFLPFVLIRRMSIKQLSLRVMIVLLVGIPLVFSNIPLNVACYFVPYKKISHYFLNRASFGFLIEWFVQGLILFIVFYLRKYTIKYKVHNKFVEIVYKMNIYLIAIFPLYIINATFGRIFRVIMIPNYILYSIVVSAAKKREKVILFFGGIIFAFFLFIYYGFASIKHTVIFALFEKNLFFDYIYELFKL